MEVRVDENGLRRLLDGRFLWWGTEFFGHGFDSFAPRCEFGNCAIGAHDDTLEENREGLGDIGGQVLSGEPDLLGRSPPGRGEG